MGNWWCCKRGIRHSYGKNSKESVRKAVESIENSQLIRNRNQVVRHIATCTKPLFVHLWIGNFEEKRFTSSTPNIKKMAYADNVTKRATLGCVTFVVNKNQLVPCNKDNLNKLLVDCVSTKTRNENVFDVINQIKKTIEKLKSTGIILTISSYWDSTHFVKTYDSYVHFETDIVRQFDDDKWRYPKSLGNNKDEIENEFVRVFILEGCKFYDKKLSHATHNSSEHVNTNENLTMFFVSAETQTSVPYELFYHSLLTFYYIKGNYYVSFDRLAELMAEARNICVRQGKIKNSHSIETSHGLSKKSYLLLNHDFTEYGFELAQWKQGGRLFVFLVHHISWIVNIYGIVKLCFYLQSGNLFLVSIICLILPYIYIWYILIRKYCCNIDNNNNNNYYYYYLCLLLSSNPITSVLLWIMFEYIDLMKMQFKDNFQHLNIRMNCELYFQLVFILLINIHLYIVKQEEFLQNILFDTFLPSFIYTLANLIYIFMHSQYCYNHHYGYYNFFQSS